MRGKARRRALACAMGIGLAIGAAGPADARPSLVVEAAAVGTFGGFEQVEFTVECAAADARYAIARLERCSVGPVSALGGGCFECVNPPVAFTRGTAPLGPRYELCVAASSYGVTGYQYVSKCAPIDPITSSAVIAG